MKLKKIYLFIIIINLIKSLEPHRIPLILVKYRALKWNPGWVGVGKSKPFRTV
jgi:hypothetical protein